MYSLILYSHRTFAEELADLLADELLDLEALLLGEGVRLRPLSLEDEEAAAALFLLANSASRLGARELTTASSALLSLMFRPAAQDSIQCVSAVCYELSTVSAEGQILNSNKN